MNMVCVATLVHSNLVGSVPGKSSTNNSGSDKRELYTIAHALQKLYHDFLNVEGRAYGVEIKLNCDSLWKF